MVFMVEKEAVFVFFMVFAVAAVLMSDASLTGKAITSVQTSAGVDLCKLNNLQPNCLFVERQSSTGGAILRQIISPTDWAQRLKNFGVDCTNVLQGRMVLDAQSNLLAVEIIIGKGGATCKFNGAPQSLTEGSRVVYTPQDITAFLKPESTGFFKNFFAQQKVPKIISSSVFPSESQVSTRNVINVCFKDAPPFSLVEAEIKGSDGKIWTVLAKDDGEHFDGKAGDGCYGAVTDGLLQKGKYSLSYYIIYK
jgi:hypothetical protein